MKPFERAHIDRADRKILGAGHPGHPGDPVVFLNDQYQVMVFLLPGNGWPDMIHLSIRRLDREAIHDWRDLQMIKNMIVGPEHEGVELYPAESRLTDSANQFHIFVLADSAQRFPFGFSERLVSEDTGSKYAHKARQRPWKPDERPPDLTSAAQLDAMIEQKEAEQNAS